MESKGNLSKNQKMILRIWKKHLANGQVGVDDDFLSLGGDSLIAAAVLSSIEDMTGISVPVGILFNKGTVNAICRYIAENPAAGAGNFRFLVPVKESGNKKPLICVHTDNGDTTTYRYIGNYMESERPVLALRFRMNKMKWPVPLTFDFLARQYAGEITRNDPDGPYFICGYCWGGVLAFKIASVLMEEGREIGMLAMFDSAAKGKGIYVNRRRASLLKIIRNKILVGIDELKGKSGRVKTRILRRKVGNAFKFLRLNISRRIYRYGHRISSKLLMGIAKKTGALDYAYQTFKPEHYNGKIHYFKSTKGREGKRRHQEYWESMADEIEISELVCHHNDLVVGDSAKELVDNMMGIMGMRDA
ncbi:MAG: thioesterase domain-containing protein [Clostridia bacterium]